MDCSRSWREVTIYSEEKYCNALVLYDKCGSATKVITQLGFPVRRQTLYNWIAHRKHLPFGRSTFRGINTVEHQRYPALELKLDAIRRCFELEENVQSVSDEIGYSKVIVNWSSLQLRQKCGNCTLHLCLLSLRANRERRASGKSSYAQDVIGIPGNFV